MIFEFFIIYLSYQTSNRSIVLSCPNSETIMIIKADFGREAYSMTCDSKFINKFYK